MRRLKPPYKITVTTREADNRRRDLDNALKALLDAITHGGLIEDDSFIDQLIVTRGEKVEGAPFVVVTITELEEKAGGK